MFFCPSVTKSGRPYRVTYMSLLSSCRTPPPPPPPTWQGWPPHHTHTADPSTGLPPVMSIHVTAGGAPGLYADEAYLSFIFPSHTLVAKLPDNTSKFVHGLVSPSSGPQWLRLFWHAYLQGGLHTSGSETFDESDAADLLRPSSRQIHWRWRHSSRTQLSGGASLLGALRWLRHCAQPTHDKRTNFVSNNGDTVTRFFFFLFLFSILSNDQISYLLLFQWRLRVVHSTQKDSWTVAQVWKVRKVTINNKSFPHHHTMCEIANFLSASFIMFILVISFCGQ